MTLSSSSSLTNHEWRPRWWQANPSADSTSKGAGEMMNDNGHIDLCGLECWVEAKKSRVDRGNGNFCLSVKHIHIRVGWWRLGLAILSVQFSSVAQSCPTVCEHMNRSMPGLPVHHKLPEFTQTQVHRVSDAIQPSHPLASPSPPALNPSQHQSLFQWVSSSHEVAKILEFQLQRHSLQRNPRADLPIL